MLFTGLKAGASTTSTPKLLAHLGDIEGSTSNLGGRSGYLTIRYNRANDIEGSDRAQRK
jgi:hypothetical protein